MRGNVRRGRSALDVKRLKPNKLRRLLQQQAILDVIVMPEHTAWRRLVSYQRLEEEKTDLFKLDNGAGDHLYALFTPKGAVLKGFDHTSSRSPYGAGARDRAEEIYQGLPEALRALLLRYGQGEAVTFCLWYLPDGTGWRQSDAIAFDRGEECDDGGERRLSGYIFSCADEWFHWASIYYELSEEAWDAALRLYETGEITRSMVADCNPERDYDAVIDECEYSGLFDL